MLERGGYNGFCAVYIFLDMFCGTVGSYDGRLILTDGIVPSIFGCSQGNKLIEKIILHIGQQTTIPHSIAEIMTVTGPDMFAKKMVDNIEASDLTVVFPPNYFHSFPGQRRYDIRNMSLSDTQTYVTPFIYPETYAMHLCYCSWQQPHLL